MTRAIEFPRMRRFVEQHRNAVGYALAGLVLASVVFDYLVGFGGPHLIGLRLVYLVLMSLLVG